MTKIWRGGRKQGVKWSTNGLITVTKENEEVKNYWRVVVIAASV
jgi:hypothetical protein